MLRVVAAVCILILSLAAHAAANILVVGDSLSAGYGLGQGQAWPWLLDKRLKDQHYDYNVINASISGDTTANGRTRFAAALDQTKPAIVIIALGANDGLRGLSIAAMRDNLTAMIRAAQARKARLVLVGMKLPPNYGSDYTRKFEETYPQLAKAYRTALVPFLFTGMALERDYFQVDGIHPTAAAQPILLDNVWKALLPMLKR